MGPLIEYCKEITERLIIVTDSNLLETWGSVLKQRFLIAHIAVELLSIPAGEIHKTRETKQNLEDRLFEKQCGRDTCLIALGGGMVMDLVGFVAATYCRGIPVIYVPTTLLGMVDASMGGKTGVDTPFGKNLIGAFCQPKAVFFDLELLKTLPFQEWRNGIVEMLKHGLIASSALFKRLEAHASQIQDPAFLLPLIQENRAIKEAIIEQDPRDFGLRQLLNFGHTIGHAIEMLENYRLSHGEAVAIGMIVEAHLSALSGFLDEEIVDEIEHTLRAYGLSLKTTAFLDLKRLKSALGLDKKALGNVPYFVLLSEIGKTHRARQKYVFAVEPKILDQALHWAKKRFME